MEKTDILVVGNSAASLVTSLVTKRAYAEKKIIVKIKDQITLVSCSITFVFNSADNTDDDILSSNNMYGGEGVNIKIGEVFSIDRKNKVCMLKDGEEIGYEKLVMSTDSTPDASAWL